MKFLLDENISKSVALFLTQLGHTTFRIKKIYPGAEDFQVLELAIEKEAILITLDKDYGELVFKEGRLHTGIVFLRLDDQTISNVKRVIIWFLSKYPEDKIMNKFAVVIVKEGKLKVRFKKNELQN